MTAGAAGLKAFPLFGKGEGEVDVASVTSTDEINTDNSVFNQQLEDLNYMG